MCQEPDKGEQRTTSGPWATVWKPLLQRKHSSSTCNRGTVYAELNVLLPLFYFSSLISVLLKLLVTPTDCVVVSSRTEYILPRPHLHSDIFHSAQSLLSCLSKCGLNTNTAILKLYAIINPFVV